MSTNLHEVIANAQEKIGFSGSVYVSGDNHILIEESYGYANRSEEIKNTSSTRYGIASGCKLFTAIAICQLVEAGKITFDSRLSDCVDIDFKHFDLNITIHHLLTHTSGVADYFDEEVMDDFEELWIKNPMYHIRNLSDFLPLFQHEQMKNQVGEKFHYNNAGFILLGLIVEKISGVPFTEYVQKHIFDKANMTDSGYFSFDRLPAKTALGYIDNADGTWRTNIYSLPAKGGSDGGAYVTVADMAKLWKAFLNDQLLSESYTKKMLLEHAKVSATGSYGYGVWIKKQENRVLKYHVMGYDPGVSFHSAYYPDLSVTVVVCSNKSDGAFDILSAIEKQLI